MSNESWIFPFTNRRYLDAVADHVVLFDGATGTQLAKLPLTPDDFGGAQFEGLMEMLLFHRPDYVEQVHAAYLEAGAEAIKTNTFRAHPLTLRTFGIEARIFEIGQTAASLACHAARRVQAATGVPRFVAGSIGPSGKLPSLDDPELSDMTFAQLVKLYAAYARGLVVGGVDLLLLETHQDLLELKAAIAGVWCVFRELEVRIPIQAQMTLEPNGHMLSGPDVEAAVVTLSALPVDIIGMNCSTGPEEMRPSLRRLLALSHRPVSVMPNAGMPDNVDGKAVYHMAPDPFASAMVEFVEWGARVVGGCCGTGPEHITTLHAHLGERFPPGADARLAYPLSLSVQEAALPYVTSNVAAVALHQQPRPLLIGERINTQGSRRAKRLVLEEHYAALLELAQTQVDRGAHTLDVCVALTERGDEGATMERVVKMLTLNTSAPLVIDTTDVAVMRAALEVYPGRPILNSVNLEAGEACARAVLALARKFGATLIALTIDETGMAKTAAHKLAVAQRLYHLAVDALGLPPHALIFDPLTFSLATGDVDNANAAVETLAAIRRIKAELPGALTNLGVSNVSYGLKSLARSVLNSVFLYQAVEAGLDMAIVNPAQITPYADIPSAVRDLAEDVLLNRDSDALTRYIDHFEDSPAWSIPDQVSDLPPERQLYDALIYRRREGLEVLLDQCLQDKSPVEVLNEVLFPAMKEVGDRFGSGELILPFVLQSAEVMKAAVKHLEPHFAHVAQVSKGTIVLATVFGDVHDIGKNLVKTIWVHNGYTVYDLGKQVPVDVIIDKAVAVQADAIGLSALLVATSQQMQRVVEELHRRGLRIPVLVGGAAVNERFAQRIAVLEDGDLYMGGVYHCQHAFEGLQVLEHVVMHKPDLTTHTHVSAEEGHSQPTPTGQACTLACATCTQSPHVETGISIPTPPFWGAHPITSIPWDELEALLDQKSLFRVGWGARGVTGEKWAALQKDFAARFATMWPEARAYLAPQAVYGYFPVQSEGNAVCVYDPEDPEARREIARFHFPRQPGGACLCLADYFASSASGHIDVLPIQVVTVGPGPTARYGALDAAGAYSEAYFVHGLAAHTAEAAAEWMHRHIRRELGLEPERGKRYSWGYSPCPDVTAHRTVFRLLPVGEKLGMSLSPVAQLIPEHSTAAIVAHHPQAKYFVVKA